ncbi:hypothetical protein AVEN_73433-1, partial [Araneus ventricosus]
MRQSTRRYSAPQYAAELGARRTLCRLG